MPTRWVKELGTEPGPTGNSCGAPSCKGEGHPQLAREKVVEAVMYYEVAEVKKEMGSAGYKKLDKIKNQDCRAMQQYKKDKSLEDSRLEFRWLTDMIDTRNTMPVRREEDLSSLP